MKHALRDIADLATTLEAHGVPPIPDVDRALALGEELDTIRNATTPGRLLDLDATELADHFRDLVIHHEPGPVGNAVAQMSARLATEAAEAIAANASQIVAALRPAFNEAAAAVAAAVAAGLRPGMTAQDVIELGNVKAVQHWRDLTTHARTLSNIAALRVRLSRTLEVAPWISPAEERLTGPADHTVSFVDPATGVRTGWSNDRAQVSGQNVWLGLAVATAGRLKLNNPAEVEAVLKGEGDSPGWIVAAHGATVYDDEGRALHLYTGDWLPSWVDADQIANALDHGLIVAAHPNDTRPADTYPLSAQAG